MTRENWKKSHWSTGGDEARSRPTMVDLGVLRIELKGTPWVLLELKGVQRKLRSQLRGAQVTERERVQRHAPPGPKVLPRTSRATGVGERGREGGLRGREDDAH